jgi:hypothetical protein
VRGGLGRVNWGVFVVPVVVGGDYHHVVFTRGSSSTALAEFCRGSEVWFLDRLADGGGGLVDTESELHSLDSAGEGVVTSLAVALLLDCAFSDHVSGVVALEVGSFKLLDAPKKRKKKKQGLGLFQGGKK